MRFKIYIIICLAVGLYAQDQNWVYRYNGLASGSDFGYSLAYGDDGNIYAAGKGYTGSTSEDFVVISTTSSGSERWVYSYNGSANSVDCANVITYGTDGNIYAAGYSRENSNDITVVSLTGGGNERWIYHYNGPNDSTDYVNAIVYGVDGNIYVTGGSYGIGSKLDIVVISLTSDGNERWVYRFNGQGNNDDCAYSLVYGIDGNIYLAGNSSGYSGATKMDLVVISLTTSGIQNWFYLYNGSSSKDDWGTAVIYGADGDIYATGYSKGSSDDIIVIGLSTAGVEQWVYRYDGPSYGADRATSIIYGNDNNLYVSGETWGGSSNEIDFLVLSVSTSGTEQWVYNYNSPSNRDDYAYSIVYGDDDNLYASGYREDSVNSDDFIVLSVNNSGTERWVYRHNGSADANDCSYSVVYGGDGNIYAVGSDKEIGTQDDFITISLTNNGNERWIYQYDGLISGRDRAYSVVYGEDNLIYAAGESYGGGWAFQKFTVVGLNGSGTEQWVYRYSGTGNADEFANYLIYGLDGNLYASGQSYDTISHNDFTVISLTTAGSERWVYRYDYNNNTDWASELTFGIDGNIYATGTSQGGSGHSHDFTIVSLSSLGIERWTYRYNGSEYNSYDHGLSVIQGSDGNIYAAGYSKESGSGYDFTVISLNSSGNQRWIYRHSVPADSGGAAYSIVYGNDDNLYIAGYDYSPSFDFIVISIDTSGQERWVYRYNGPGNGYDMANHIIYGEDGNLYIAGHTEGVGTSLDFTVISLNTSGAERWVYQYNGPWNVADFAEYVVYGDDGNIYVTGGSYDSGPANELEDFIVASLDTSGVEKWLYLYNGPGDGPDFAYQLDYGADGNLYIAGMSLGVGTKWDFTVLSLNPNDEIVEENFENTDCFLTSVSLLQTGNEIKFSLNLPHAGKIGLSIFNILGQLVHSEEFSAPEGKSEHLLPFQLTSGVYFLQVDYNGKILKRKICFIK